ncbi:carnitine O-palmitoyltransferase 2, mitochondrial-like isoform X2 [Trichosurus vulpecula]|uniref:carnitine O-palmitoyltransferase 2, mitochondrial-like isoform X2 n=1 Tax=Trichosurus vulpecula TaxID=9337 RepID=UPI00186B0B90|nr:carnitine O-palmitoyltransferase 2, mitochondrial-like isoform X2 [Trichosurus vulpecula]
MALCPGPRLLRFVFRLQLSSHGRPPLRSLGVTFWDIGGDTGSKRGSKNAGLVHSIVPTLHYQGSLPRLPIPRLEDSIARYLRAQKPLLTAGQFRRTAEFCFDFQHGLGRELHDMLLFQDEHSQHTSYISGRRNPPAFNMNVGLAFQPDPKAEYNDQLTRATNMTISIIRFLRAFRTHTLEPEVLHLYPEKTDNELFEKFIRWIPKSFVCQIASMFNVYPMDMSQNFRLFSTSRLPKFARDTLHTDERAKHLLVLRNGNFYIFNILQSNGTMIQTSEIYANLKYILSDQSPMPDFPLAYLTTEKRDTWAQLRQELLANGNREALKKVETAIFSLCLDDLLVQDVDHFSQIMLFGNGHNRWFDKSFNLILTKDGSAAINFEHSWGDAMTVLRFMKEVFLDSTEAPAVQPREDPVATDASKAVKKLHFHLNDSLREGITNAKANYDTAARNFSVKLVQFEKEGKHFLKQEGVSPDAMIQLAFQMAFLGLYGQVVSSYEPCSTAAFKHGRTEVIRPTSIHTKKCSLAFQEPSKHSVDELKGMLYRCSTYHVQLIKEATHGQGFDRHLLALRILADTKKGCLPNIFFDSAYSQLNHSFIFSRHLFNPTLNFGASMPIVPDGFGITYFVQDNSITFNISSCSDYNLQDFIQILKTSLEKIVVILKGKPITH